MVYSLFSSFLFSLGYFRELSLLSCPLFPSDLSPEWVTVESSQTIWLTVLSFSYMSYAMSHSDLSFRNFWDSLHLETQTKCLECGTHLMTRTLNKKWGYYFKNTIIEIWNILYYYYEKIKGLNFHTRGIPNEWSCTLCAAFDIS